MVPDLIFDLGMHQGGDTEFYLNKGYRVVAVEANPDLCAKATERFKSWIGAGRLFIVASAISDRFETRQFYIDNTKDEWSSLVEQFGTRTGDFTKVEVSCVTLSSLFAIFGVPYYLKIDIEGLDDECIHQLSLLKEFPRYVSVEATVDRFSDKMHALGYRSFKLIGQRLASLHRPEGSPLEGRAATPGEAGVASGHFGEETYGAWMNKGEFDTEFSLLGERRFAEMRHHRDYGVPLSALSGDDWHDLHARYGF